MKICSLIMLITALTALFYFSLHNQGKTVNQTIIELAQPQKKGSLSLEEAIQKRCSIRNYAPDTITLPELAQLLWAAQGITHDQYLRTAPSAGALYPMELYLVAGNVKNLTPGIYKYQIDNHTLTIIAEGDNRIELSNAAHGQSPIANAPAIIVITGIYTRTTRKYGERGIRFVHMEAGHISENIYLQATALNLATVAIGAFEDDVVKKVAHLQQDEEPLYLMPIGQK